MSETEYPEPDPTLSSDAKHSTYEAAPQEEGNPPPGPGVIQTKGKPTEETTTRKTSSKTSSSSSSSS